MTSLRLALARTLAWSLLLGGWLVLGEIGQRETALAANGLAPLALWLAVVGSAFQASRAMLMSARELRGIVLVSGLGCSLVLVWSGVAAIILAAVCWGVLLVAASRVVRLIRSTAPRASPPVVPAAIGAIAAWWFGAHAPTLAAPAVAIATLVLALLLPQGAASRACRAGLFDCALPLAPASWRDPSAWGLHAARWSMLPMMATLAVMAQWCGDSLTATEWIAIHLAAMLLPACVLHGLGLRPRAAWVTLVMVLGLLALLCLPGWRGLMLMSACQSAAWGLSWLIQLGERSTRVAAPRWRDAVLPAIVVLSLGIAIAWRGPLAIEAVQAGLAGTAIVAWCAARLPTVARRLS